jgi:uncharacterized membrane protein
VYQASVFIHVVSAAIWVGGMFFLALVVVPVARRLPPAERGALLDALGRRFRAVGWVCIALLIATGSVNSAYRGVRLESIASGRLFADQVGRLLAAKLALVAVMLALSVAHDFVVGPASVRALAGAAGPMAERGGALRRRASWLARLNTLLALLVIALAVALVRGLPW